MAKRSYKFTAKKHTKQGMASSALALLALILLVLGLVLSFRKAGKAGAAAGLVGFASMAASFAGFVFGVRGFHEEDVYYFFSQIGVVLNGILFILWVLIFVAGM